MVSGIQLGNFFNSGGKTVLGGSSSGLDTQKLLESLVAAKTIPVTKLEDSIKLDNSQIGALNDMKSILVRLKDASNFLRNPPGVQNDADNIFQYRTAALTSNTAIAGSTYLGATISPGAAAQSYVITDVTTLAQAKKQGTENFVVANADTAVADAAPGPNQLGVGTITLKGQNITINSGDTLNNIAAKFNAVKSLTNIRADILQVSPGEFQLTFTATATGTSTDFDLNNPADMNDPSGVFANITVNNIQLADIARFKLDGVDITRETNEIDDLINKASISLKQITPPGTTIKLDIQPDSELIKTGITNFVNAYNDFKIFAAKQTEVGSDGRPTEDALLFNNPTMRSILARVQSELARSVPGIAPPAASTLADIGIKFGDYPGDDTTDPATPATRNILTIDDGKLQSAITANLDEVQGIFGFSMTSDSSDLQVFSRTNALNATNMTLNVDMVGSIYQANIGGTLYDLDATALSTGGVTLKGQKGTPLEGLVMIYSSAVSNNNITISMSQGISDRMFNSMNDVLESQTGMVTADITSLSEKNTRHQKEIDRLNTSIEEFRNQLLQKFADLERAISSVNTLLQSLDAQAQARANA